MPTTITHSAGTILPIAVEGYRAARPIRNLVHDALNRSSPDITYRPAGLRSGTFNLVFDSEASALNAFAVLAVPQAFTITNVDLASLNMRFVVAGGDLDIEQDRSVAGPWRVAVPFQEVTP